MQLPEINTLDLHKKYKKFTDVRVIGLFMFGLVVLLITWSSFRVLQVNYELQKKEAYLRQKNEITKLENENLKLKNTYLETDEYLELTARRQFNKAIDGETLYLIPKEVAMSKTIDTPQDKAEEEAAKSADKSKYRQNLEEWMNFLFKTDS